MRFLGAVTLVLGLVGTAFAQPTKPVTPIAPIDKTKPPVAKRGVEQEIVIGGIKLFGTDRGVKLLYFLERASEELERASLQKRSFIPEMARTVDSEKL